MTIDDHHALMDRAEFEALPEYKPRADQTRWRMRFRGLWWFAWRDDHGTHHREILLA